MAKDLTKQHIVPKRYLDRFGRKDGKDAKRVTRREWAIGIVCTIIGAVIGLIPYIATLLSAAN